MLRGFTRGKSDLCFMDMIDLSGRIQELNELKFQGKTIDDNILPPQWPQDIDNNLKKGMEMAEREVLKTLDHLNMLPALINTNVVQKDGNDIVCINHPVLQTFTVWPASENRYDGPDETTVISSEELLELDNGILLETLDQIDESHRGALISIAATASLQEGVDESHRGALISIAATASLQEGVEDANEDEEDDSPSQCALYRNKACKYQDPSFKQPKTTNWIGCSYPTCNLWYHEQCLSLHITSEQTRQEYTLICSKHKEIRQHFKDKITALDSDTHSLYDTELSLQPLPKRLKRSSSSVAGYIDHDHMTYSARPNYVEYEGQYFHMAEFLSLQQGKVYRPMMSRLSRWLESARNDFYENVEKSVRPLHVTSGVYLKDIVALWIPSKGLSVGHVTRMVTSPLLKSSYPIFEYKVTEEKKERRSQSASKHLISLQDQQLNGK
jgi:hypothetical protein